MLGLLQTAALVQDLVEDVEFKEGVGGWSGVNFICAVVPALKALTL